MNAACPPELLRFGDHVGSVIVVWPAVPARKFVNPRPRGIRPRPRRINRKVIRLELPDGNQYIACPTAVAPFTWGSFRSHSPLAKQSCFFICHFNTSVEDAASRLGELRSSLARSRQLRTPFEAPPSEHLLEKQRQSLPPCRTKSKYLLSPYVRPGAGGPRRLRGWGHGGHAARRRPFRREVCFEEFQSPPDKFARHGPSPQELKPCGPSRVIHHFDRRILGQLFGR